MSPDHKSHDKFVKFIFSYPEKAKDYLRLQLPEKLKEIIDLESLELTTDSFINVQLKESFTDIVFKVKMNDIDKPLFISILIEHKSYKDNWVTIQIGHYIFSSLINQIKNVGSESTIIPVVPILFYHGVEAWDYHTHRSLYKNFDEEVLKYIPDYEYIFHNLNSQSDSEITNLDVKFWSGIFYMLKHAKNEERLITGAGIIFEVVDMEDRNLLKVMFVYFSRLVRTKANMMKAIEFMPDPIKGEARNAYEEFILEGEERGMIKQKVKIAISSFENGADISFISKILELSEKEVKKILSNAGLIKK